jgi:hypothetical protein
MSHSIATKGFEERAMTQQHMVGSSEPTGLRASGRSLLAEYAMMLMMVHVVFCGLMRLATIVTCPLAITGIAASVWIVLRTVRCVRVRWFYPILTLSAAVAVLQWDRLSVQESSSVAVSLLWRGGGHRLWCCQCCAGLCAWTWQI